MPPKESTPSVPPLEGHPGEGPDDGPGQPGTDTCEGASGTGDGAGEASATTEGRGADGSRTGLAVAGALLLVCGGLVGYGLLDTEEQPKPRAVPTAEVTYEVTGEGPVEIAYLARSESGTATVVRGAELPWRATVRVPLGQEPSVAITLGEKGGRAVCTLAVRGEHVQLATASGGYGRATCAGALPPAAN
ncbi:hypothetical protein ACFU9F_02445 [Streptomyces zhihengii]|uniref:hypothetical protein n=1 Tax=Streptomyces zhihengii TaxID=1818004 RepID=UPI0036A7E0EF